MEAKAGDRIVVESEKVGTVTREGVVLEVLSAGAEVHYRVRWADGHSSVLFPSAGNVSVLPSAKPSKPRRN